MPANDRTLWRTYSSGYGGVGGFRRFHHRQRAVLFVVLYQLSKGCQRRDADFEVLVASNARTRASVPAILRMAPADRIAAIIVGRRRRRGCSLASEQSPGGFCCSMGFRNSPGLFA